MPMMPLIDQSKRPEGINPNDWVIYSDHIPSRYFGAITDFNLVSKNFYMCNMSGTTVANKKFSSIFQKCDLKHAFFSNCTFTEKVMFIECELDKITFDGCIFEKEELLIFLKMSGVKIIDCRAKGKNGLENWNV